MVAAAGALAAAAPLAQAQPQPPAQAQPQPPVQVQPGRPTGPYWNVNHGELYCTLGRDSGPDAVNFAIRVIPGTDRVELLVTSRGWARLPLSYGQAVRLALSPGEGKAIETQALTGRLPSGAPLLVFLNLGEDFVDRVASATRLRVVRGRRDVLVLDFANAGRAVATLRECFDRRLADWGIDMAARGRMRSLPEPTNVPFSDSDYPSAALRADAQGLVIVRLMVAADGSIGACAVLRSSGSAALDARTCQVYTREGRFRPAIDADGRPVAAGIISSVTWRIVG